ncbi:hypothetical protein F4803DRAFT_550119 [Xylaria telfairii]|nr:hypothetical protein F4803DRAFT_550119 [Xylaria telfairii]
MRLLGLQGAYLDAYKSYQLSISNTVAMFQSILVALFPVLIALPQTLAGNLIVHNQCDFEIWCGSAANDGTFTPAALVHMGQAYVSPQPAVPGEKGVVVKCGRRSDLGEPYQLEVAQDADSRTWFDLSSLDGRPFERYKRHAEILGTAQQAKLAVNGHTSSTVTRSKTWS